MNYFFNEKARAEFLAAMRYYEAEQPGLGRRFLREADRCLEHARAFPEAFAKVDDQCRRAPMRRFPYGVIYRRRGERLEVMAVMHLHREPGYWRDQVE